MKDKLGGGIRLRLQLAASTVDQPKEERLEFENREYIGSTKNMIRDKLTEIANRENGETFNLYVMRQNR